MLWNKEFLDNCVQEDREAGLYRVDRGIFTSEELFEKEMEHIFEGNWIYLGHESQLLNKNDYYTTRIGRQPVFIARDGEGKLNAFLNVCSHRGAMLLRNKCGNKGSYTCPFHGWTFSNRGQLLKVKDDVDAGYPATFNCNGSHDLQKLARFESYRGFLFGSLREDVGSLRDFLGEARTFIDFFCDQAPQGLEVLRGTSSYIYEGNWKVHMENGADGYHVTTVHWNYAATQQQRKQRVAADVVRTMSASGWGKKGGGFYSFENGHLMLWSRWENPEDRPLFPERDRLITEFGEVRADWMLGRSRNLCLYPNTYVMDQFGSQIRTVRPISANRTEVEGHCFVPRGESPEVRARRIRQYEDFFNASGLATPDDLEEFRACQEGFRARGMRWSDMSRGAMHWIDGPDEEAEAIGLKPLRSGLRTEDEGLFVVQHRYWQAAMKRGLEREAQAAANETTQTAATGARETTEV